MTEAEKQQDLKKLQDAIYMDKVRRARAMTPEERLEDFFELSDEMMKQMLAGAMWQLATDDVDSRWNEVRERLGRLDRCARHRGAFGGGVGAGYLRRMRAAAIQGRVKDGQ